MIGDLRQAEKMQFAGRLHLMGKLAEVVADAVAVGDGQAGHGLTTGWAAFCGRCLGR